MLNLVYIPEFEHMSCTFAPCRFFCTKNFNLYSDIWEGEANYDEGYVKFTIISVDRDQGNNPHTTFLERSIDTH